ncbi:hypothetical protein OF83DRAFT_1173246 [Amylostereum chailletii]|nr:hypothetical protein OF83DRAFT_1173246 [Amylostereum chailletii]
MFPGIHVPEREIWLAISRLLGTFRIKASELISLEECEGIDRLSAHRLEYVTTFAECHVNLKVHCVMTDGREEVMPFECHHTNYYITPFSKSQYSPGQAKAAQQVLVDGLHSE